MTELVRVLQTLTYPSKEMVKEWVNAPRWPADYMLREDLTPLLHSPATEIERNDTSKDTAILFRP